MEIYFFGRDVDSQDVKRMNKISDSEKYNKEI